MTYLGNPVSQIDGSWAQNLNCVLANTSELGDCSSLGYYRISPSRLRQLSGDYVGGVTYSNAADTLNRATNGEVKLAILYWVPQSTLDDLLTAPRVVSIIIDAGVTRYTPFRTGTFTGSHAVVVGRKRMHNGQKQALVMDPGRTKAVWVWWPWSLLTTAANSQAGGNNIHVMYTRDLAGVTRATKDAGTIRSSPYTLKDPSNKVGEYPTNKLFTVTATVRGGAWTVRGMTGRGWSKIAPSKYIAGGKLR